MKIITVIPVYNEASHIAEVLKKIPGEIDEIVVVDDCSEDKTVEAIRSVNDKRITLLQHEKNKGVGSATITGYKYCLQQKADIVVKIDGDGQMDPCEMPRVIAPVIKGKADYAKGFRFNNAENLRQMPIIRLLGNIFLSFLTKLASGYWNIFDPTSGYTAIHKDVLSRLRLEILNQRYFFETDVLIQLYRIHAVVCDVEISISYGTEKSHLHPLRSMIPFFYLLSKAFLKRIVWRYFLIDFTAVSLFIIMGIPLFLFGFGFGLYHWIANALANIATPTGTIMIAVVSLFFGFQFLLQAIVLDIDNIPKNPIQIVNMNQ